MTNSIPYIKQILTAKSLYDILQTSNLEPEYKKISKTIHPDLCAHPKAHAAMSKLNALKKEFVEGKAYEDDAGPFRNHGKLIRFKGDPELLQRSLKNYLQLMRHTDKTARHFQRYLPKRTWVEDDALVMELEDRAVPLSELIAQLGPVPQQHVNWILSRMLEFSGWLSQMRYVHAGLNPESIFVVPKTHGIIVSTFYHLRRKGEKLRTISGKYTHWYTPSVFTEKRAISLIDTELCKKTATCLLGDPSGMATRLKRTHNPDYVNFLIQQDRDPYSCYKSYRKLLARNFTEKFHHLDI